MPDALSLGPLAIPPTVFGGLVALVVTTLILRLRLTGDEGDRRWLRERGGTALLVGFLVWKLTPLVSYAGDILADPVLLLRIPGGRPGLFAGALAAAGVLLPGVLGAGRRGRLRVAALAALSLSISYVFAITLLGAVATPRSADLHEIGSVEVEYLDGSTAALHRGDRVTILGFWATWCGPCRAELPVKKRFYDEYRDRVRYLAVNMFPSEAGIDAVRAYVRENELPYSVVLDRDGGLASLFSVIGTPTTIVLAPDGTVIDRWLGPAGFDRLSRLVERFPPPLPGNILCEDCH